MKTGKISNHPLAVVELPVKRCAPVFTIDGFPAFGKPPAEVFISAVLNEREKVSDADRSFIDREVLEEHLMRRLFIVERELV